MKKTAYVFIVLAAFVGVFGALQADKWLTKRLDSSPISYRQEAVVQPIQYSGAVASLTLAQIREADAGARFAGPDGSYPYRGRGLTVPTLSEVLAWLPDATRVIGSSAVAASSTLTSSDSSLK